MSSLLLISAEQVTRRLVLEKIIITIELKGTDYLGYQLT
jgi:hypothetical protein